MLQIFSALQTGCHQADSMGMLRCRHKKTLAVGTVLACLAVYGFLHTPYGASSRAAIVGVGQYLAKVWLQLCPLAAALHMAAREIRHLAHQIPNQMPS